MGDLPILHQVGDGRLGDFFVLLSALLILAALTVAVFTYVRKFRLQVDYPEGERVGLRIGVTLLLAVSLIPAVINRDGGYFAITLIVGALVVRALEAGHVRRSDNGTVQPEQPEVGRK